MIISLLFLAWLISGGLIISIQLRYAWANYPDTTEWFLLRFGSSFISGILIGIVVFYRNFHGAWFVIPVLLSGFAFGIGYTFVFRHNLQNLIPKRDPSEKEEDPSR